MAEGEVVFDWILWIQAAERRGDIPGHGPSRTRVSRQAQATPDADDVSVERHDELRRCNAGPDAQIQRVAAHHPPEKQVQSLAAASGRGPWEKVGARRPRR